MPRHARKKPHLTAPTQDAENHRIASALERAARSGPLPCADAHAFAKTLGVSPIAVGKAADDLDIRIVNCQLGLFDQSKNAPSSEFSENKGQMHLRKTIEDNMVRGRLPCARAWAIADTFKLKRFHLGTYCDAAGIKISHCQLGLF